jgi:hypothetical protein
MSSLREALAVVVARRGALAGCTGGGASPALATALSVQSCGSRATGSGRGLAGGGNGSTATSAATRRAGLDSAARGRVGAAAVVSLTGRAIDADKDAWVGGRVRARELLVIRARPRAGAGNVELSTTSVELGTIAEGQYVTCNKSRK